MSQHHPVRAAPCRHRSGWIALAACLWVPAFAGTPSLEDILARTAPADGVIASEYTQIRESGLLTEEVRVEGEIRYRSPGTLYKTEEDSAGTRTVVIDERTVRIESADGTRTFSLARSPQLEALMMLLEGFARGDAASVREHFSAEVDGTEADWQLRLEARRRDTRGEGQTRPLRIRVSGHEASVRRIVLDSPASGRVTLELTGEPG